MARRLGAGLFSLAWLPAGIALAAMVHGRSLPAEPDAWLSLVPVAPCGLPLALAWVRLRKVGYPGAAWASFLVLAPATAFFSLFAGLLGPIAIAAYAIVLSLPAWALYTFLRLR